MFEIKVTVEAGESFKELFARLFTERTFDVIKNMTSKAEEPKATEAPKPSRAPRKAAEQKAVEDEAPKSVKKEEPIAVEPEEYDDPVPAKEPEAPEKEETKKATREEATLLMRAKFENDPDNSKRMKVKAFLDDCGIERVSLLPASAVQEFYDLVNSL